MTIKYCKICNSSMWFGTDKPENFRKGICDWCAKEQEKELKILKELKKEEK